MKKTLKASEAHLSEIAEILTGEGPFLVVSHRNPDGDSIGSALALATWLEGRRKDVSTVLPEGLPEPYGFLSPPSSCLKELPQDLDDTWAFVLDSSDLSRLDGDTRALSGARSIINIDHHPDNSSFGTLNYVDPTASSASLLVYEILGAVGDGMDADVASLLYVGIMTDTGGFRHGNTDSRSFSAAGELVRLGADPQALSMSVYGDQPLGSLRLLGLVLASARVACEGQVVVMCLTDDMRLTAGDDGKRLEGLASYGELIAGVRVSVLMREEGENVRSSLRSDGSVNVNAAATALGGGGHRTASGVLLPGPLEDARSRVLEALGGLL